MKKFVLFSFSLILILSGCGKSDNPVVVPYSPSLIIKIHNSVNDQQMKKDTLVYQNALGQYYMINDLQYFISQVKIHSTNTGWKSIKDGNGIHYFDADIPSTENWQISDIIYPGKFDSVSFIFGMNEDDNISNRFPDPPMRDMFWPEVLGGGYHYMKMNLKWKNDTMNQQKPFMFHLGIGQVYSGEGNDPSLIIGYVQNYFRVTLPCDFTIRNGETATLNLRMNIEKWFSGNNNFDFSAYPMGIMQNQDGMFKAVQNGKNVFSL